MSHPARAHIHKPGTFGERLADATAAQIGSWRFLIIQCSVLAAWLLINTFLAIKFDPPPFILLNLMLSFQAAFTGPVLLLAATRSAARDRIRDDTEAAEVELSTHVLSDLHALIADLHAHTTCDGHTTVGSKTVVTP